MGLSFLLTAQLIVFENDNSCGNIWSNSYTTPLYLNKKAIYLFKFGPFMKYWIGNNVDCCMVVTEHNLRQLHIKP